MTALYSINLHIMGKSNVPLMSERTLATIAESAAMSRRSARARVARLRLGGQRARRRRARRSSLVVAATSSAPLLYLFLRTNLGTAMQAAGDNAQMIRALGVNVDNMIVLGLALVQRPGRARRARCSTQYQGFADVQMGIGMVVWGLASVIIGEALVGTRDLGLRHHRRRSWARCCSGCSWRSRCAAASTRTT